MKKVLIFMTAFLMLACFINKEVKAADSGGTQNSYNIVIIESDEQVPLAADIPNTMFPKVVIAVIAFLALGVLFVIYVLSCHKHRDRVRILLKKMNQTNHFGAAIRWNLFQLNKLEDELESLVAASIELD